MISPKTGDRKRGHSLILPLGLLVLAVVFIVAGVMQGDALAVLRKAVLICYECIGIG